jgi:hypothetical protein
VQALLVLPLWVQSVYTSLVVMLLEVEGIQLVLYVDHLSEDVVLDSNKS